MPEFTAYHGYKHPDHGAAMEAGLSRAEGNAGNFEADWQGFYVARTPQNAAGYSITENSVAAAAGLHSPGATQTSGNHPHTPLPVALPTNHNSGLSRN